MRSDGFKLLAFGVATLFAVASAYAQEQPSGSGAHAGVRIVEPAAFPSSEEVTFSLIPAVSPHSGAAVGSTGLQADTARRSPREAPAEYQAELAIQMEPGLSVHLTIPETIRLAGTGEQSVLFNDIRISETGRLLPDGRRVYTVGATLDVPVETQSGESLGVFLVSIDYP